jgi:NAD(P)-dependent dehydrogenase (short-subunit alcohol dehydrogenase family)
MGSLAAAKAMAKQNNDRYGDTPHGAIVVTSSVSGLVPYHPDPIYSTTKHGISGWVRSVAPTMQMCGVTIDAVCPAGVATPLIGLNGETDIPTVLSPADVAAALIETAMESESGRCISLVAGRDDIRQDHSFSPVPGFSML